jgi:hypothetical protein
MCGCQLLCDYFYLHVLETSRCVRYVADFFTDMFVYFFLEIFLAAAGLSPPRHIATVPTRHSLASPTPPSPRYNLYFHIMVVDHVTQLDVTRSKDILCRYADLFMSTNESVLNCPRFLDGTQLCGWGYFLCSTLV